MSDKQYLCAEQLLTDSFRLAKSVLDSGFEPTMIIAIWRGGVPIGIAVQEFFAFSGVETDHIAIRTSSYDTGIDQRLGGVRVHGLNYLIKHVRAEDRLLIVDDVFDTGRTVDAVIDRLTELARLNTPADIRVAVPYYKPRRREVQRQPDYYLEESFCQLESLLYTIRFDLHQLTSLNCPNIHRHNDFLLDLQ